MNFEYNNTAYCVNCDWLQFSVTLNEADPELQCPFGYRLEVLPGNNIFRHRAILWDSVGNRHFTILWCPYSKLLSSLLMTCQFDNHILYADAIMQTFRLLQSVVNCEFNSMGRIDICCDFETNPRLMSVIRQLWVGDVYVQRKSEGSAFWHADNSENGRFVHCMSWGSKTSEIKVKLYNKTRELGVDEQGVAVEKQYIVDQWQQSGLKVSNIWRLEFSLVTSGQLKVDDKAITLEDVANTRWLLDTFLSLYEKRFVCRFNDYRRKGHHNDDRPCVFLMLPSSSAEIKWKESEAEPKASTEAIALLRKLVSLLDMKMCVVDDEMFQSVGSSILQLCNDKGCRAYFKFFLGASPEDWLQERFQQNGTGCHEETPSLKQNYW